MRAKKVKRELTALLIVAPLLLASACATNEHASSPATPTSLTATAPSNTEITAAIKRLAKQRRVTRYYDTFVVSSVEQDANGQWQATAYLMPPLTMSYFPAIMVIAKNPDGWRVSSLKDDNSDHPGPPPSSPSATPQPL